MHLVFSIQKPAITTRKIHYMNHEQSSQKIGAITATIISMNAMIGAGIFTTPAKLAISVGPAGIITYIFVIAAVLFMALSLARVAQLYPAEGSFYTYAKQWGGHIMGAITAGSYAIGVLIALGLLTQTAVIYLHSYFPAISNSILGSLVVISVVLLNIIGIRSMQAGQIALLSCTLFALVSTTILCFINADTHNLRPFMPYGLTSLAQAIPTIIFAFFGFEAAASLVTIVQDPQKNIPKALTYSILIVGLIYLAFISSIILAIPASQFTSDRMPISQALIKTFPRYTWFAQVIGIAIITALLGVLQSMTYAVSSLLFSFFKVLKNPYSKALVDSAYGFKIVVIIVGFCTLFDFFTIKSMALFFNLTALFIVFAYAMSILVLPLKGHDKTRSQKIVTFLGLTTASGIFITALRGLLP
jgi:amino acid transporter